eukprot:TRINITY_DN13237_c0_g1_i1.p2 TRINITY_DN13237_c0_g1~~TRINITY_DN13237_c0_g1_i1.p2  ORF type:complete len:157 (-),score=75.48 TRINITY_DN13237_c0_g1_i1:537-1007(-)
MEQSKMSSVPMKSLDPESDDEEIEDTLGSLQEHLVECKRLGKYVEAQMTKNRIEKLKEKKANAKIESVMISHKEDLKTIEETHEKDLAALKSKWRRKLEEHDEWALREQESLMDKQEKELEKARSEIAQRIPEKAHPSQELVALRKKEEALARQDE